MDQKPMSMSVGTMVCATERAKSAVNTWISLASRVIDDDEKSERLERNLCKACHYAPYRVGGACIVTRPCMCCGKVETYPSTNTDVLCAECAVAGELCKHCGGDINMRVRRKEWPVPHV